jgi:hypothetical protein
MLIAELKQQLRQHQAMSLFEMMNALNLKPEILREMLAILERKGQVRRCTKTPRCGTKCQKCSVLVTELYEWVG